MLNYVPIKFKEIQLPKEVSSQRNSMETFLGYLYNKRGNFKESHERFFQVSFNKLRSIFGDNKLIKPSIQFLLNEKIIITDNHYITSFSGKPPKSKSYALAKEWLPNATPYEIKPFPKKIKEKLEREKQNVIAAFTPLEAKLYKWVETISFDKEPTGLFDPNTPQDYFVQKIKQKDFYLKTCTYGRVHTNVTSLKKEIKKLLLLDGQEFSEVDIGNSQPLIFGALLAKDFPDQPADVKEYLSLVQESIFYDCMTDMYKKFEKPFFYRTILFGKKNVQDPFVDLFKKRFPNVFNCIQFYKKDSYKNLARLMQKMESDIMIKGVAEKLSDKPILTIHDSICTMEPDRAIALIKEEFKKLRLQVRVKRK